MNKKTRIIFWAVIVLMTLSLVVLKSKNSEMQTKLSATSQTTGN